MNNDKKSGITLMILVVTLSIIIILLGASIYTSNRLIDRADIADFTTIMSEIETLAHAYLVTNGKLPVSSNATLTYNQILSNMDSEKSVFFIQQIESNEDTKSDFYYVDLSAIGISKVDFDFEGRVVINSEGTKAYYLPGMYIDGKWYFTNYRYD